MANLASQSNGKHLWWALLGLGFQPDVAASRKTSAKHTSLGINMFDKPNKDAFHIVVHFLLEKLNPARFHDVYRHCWPVLDHKADAEFRKVTCAWLREIMNENGAGPKVVASLFLSPGGPKFTSLMLHLANHVMLQEMKAFNTDGSWVPEAAATPTSSASMAMCRFQLVKARYLKAAVEQDHFLQEYQRQAQSQVKSLREERPKGAKLDELLKRCKDSETQDQASTAPIIQKARSLWSDIDGMLSAISKERRVVEGLVEGSSNQHALDGTGVALQIPQVLLERMEQLPQHSSVGKMYEEGQLNLLATLELMNHALRFLQEVRLQADAQALLPQLQPHHLEEKSRQLTRSLEDLRLMRQKIAKEEIPEVRNNIRKLEAEWDRKWAETLKDTPLTSFLNEDPALGVLSPMAPLSFEPAAEAALKSCVFSQYSAKFSDVPEEEVGDTASRDEEASVDSAESRVSCPVAVGAETPVADTKVVPQQVTPLHELFEPSPPALVKAATPSNQKASGRRVIQARPKASAKRNQVDILNWECDNLANQFAEAVTTTTPRNGRTNGLDLEDLLTTLAMDPFSTRKQLARTPESLISDVKSSWRKAVEEDEARKAHQLARLRDDSVTEQLAPLSEAVDVPASPSPGSLHQPTTGHQEELSLLSPPSWSCPGTQLLHSLSGTGSDVALLSFDRDGISGGDELHFTLDHETLPELPGSDSLLSLSEDAPDDTWEEEDEEEELILPDILSLNSGVEPAALSARQRLEQIRQAGGDVSFVDGRTKKPERLPSPREAGGLDRRDWFMAATVDPEPSASRQHFSLDLDTLEALSPLSKEPYGLPKLVTFSPIDDD